MKNSMKKVLSLLLAVLMMASMSTAAFAEEVKEFTDDSMSGNIDFYYTVTQEDVYTDVSGVKLSWSVPVVKYTETNTLTWNTTDLKWIQTKPTSTTDSEVSFTLTNRGSYAVKANVSFTPEVTDSATVDFGETNDPTLATIVNADHSLKVTKTEGQSDADYATAKSEYVTNNCSATIKGTVSLNADNLTADSGKLGTYTVSIRNTKHTVQVMYYKTADAKDPVTDTVIVDDGTEITVDGRSVTINGVTYTDAHEDEMEWGYQIGSTTPQSLTSGTKVTADMTIIAAR